MLIIIEGADCTGKTTLARELMETNVQNGMTYITKGPPIHYNPVREYLWPLSKYIPGDGFHYICDRWHIGEMVYPNIFKREGIMNDDQFKLINGVINNLGGFIVHLEPPFDVVRKRYEERGDKMIRTIDQLWYSYEQFRTFSDETLNDTMNFIRYERSLNDDYEMDKCTRLILQHASAHEKAAKRGITL